MNNYTIYEYDIEEFPFKEVAQGMMKVDHLDQIHNVYEFPENLLGLARFLDRGQLEPCLASEQISMSRKKAKLRG